MRHYGAGNGEDMELRQLAYFKEAAETLSFTKAAQRCHVTQSTLGQQVRQIERELGCELFKRHGSSLELTDKGAKLLVSARKVLSEMANAVSDITSDAPGHTLRLGYYGNALAPHLGPILGKLRERHPDIRIDILEEAPDALTTHVLDGVLDCALTVHDPQRHNAHELSCEQIHSCPYVVLVRHGSLAAEPGSEVSIDDVPTPIITLSKIQSARLSSRLGTDDPSKTQTVGAPCNTHRTLALLTASGQCSALAPEDTWVGAAGVDAYRLAGLNLTFATCLVWRRDCTNPAISIFSTTCHRWFERNAAQTS